MFMYAMMVISGIAMCAHIALVGDVSMTILTLGFVFTTIGWIIDDSISKMVSGTKDEKKISERKAQA
jgi:hypothetical protein